jgi:signal transduction histidine kinase
MRSPRSIRSRVAISHASLVLGVLLLYIGLASSLFWWNLTRQLYSDAVQNVETAEGLLSFDARGRLLLNEDYHNHPATRQVQERLVEIRDFNTGEVLFRNGRLGNRSLGGPPFAGEGMNYSPRSYRMEDGTRVLLISHEHDIDHRTILIRQAYEIAPLIDRLQEFVVVLCLTLPLTFLIAALVGFRFASKTLQPLAGMTRRAERISAKDLHERLPVANAEDELGRLALVINGLLARIQTEVEQMQRFTGDVSHELRTPLAALRSVGEVALHGPMKAIEYEEIIGSMLEEANRLTRLVENLLLISRMDAGAVSVKLRQCDVSEILGDCAKLLDVLAQEKGQILSCDLPGVALIQADELLLRQAFINLIHNAIRFAPGGRSIAVTAQLATSGVEVHIDDEGPGIAEGDQRIIFERFSRLSADQTGAGLGLAITKWIVEEHGGEIFVSGSPLGGSRFTVRLPKESATSASESKAASASKAQEVESSHAASIS